MVAFRLHPLSRMHATMVREVMTTKNLLEVDQDDSLALAAHRMAWLRCRHLPVTKHRAVVGVVAERDLLAWKAEGRSLDGPEDKVRAAMSSPAILATPDEGIAEACARMISARVSCLPVVQHGKLVGIVTSTDLLGRHVAMGFGGTGPGELTAADVMSSSALTASPDDMLLEAADVMAWAGVRHLPIVDEAGKLVGILSERDLRTALGVPSEALEHWASALGRDRTVGDIMTKSVESARPDQPLGQLVTMMVNGRVGALPVVDRERRPVGIVSYLDILRAISR